MIEINEVVATERLENDISGKIIGAAIEVHKKLGPGLLESAYEECLCCEMQFELKSIEGLEPIHEAQMLTYLKLRNAWLGLIINFNVIMLKDGVRRLVNG